MGKNEQFDVQESVSDGINTKTAERSFGDVVGRIKAFHEDRFGSRTEEDIRHQVVMDRLLSMNFPKRSVQKLSEGMFGPGLEKANELLPRMLGMDSILVIHGDRGSGKTQMATWFGYQRGMKGLSVGRYIKTLDLMNLLKSSWVKGSWTSEKKLLEPFIRSKYLVLDEIQERPSENGLREWADQVITNLIDRRYDEKHNTIMIGNFSENAISSIVPASVISRVEECGGNVSCNWKSYRQL